MKICVITATFTVSGVPLAQLRFARALAAQGHQVDVIFAHVYPQLSLPDLPGVNLIEWEISRVRGIIRPLRNYLRQAKPDILFSAEDHLTTMVLFTAVVACSPVKISGSSRVSPLTTFSDKPFTKKWVLKRALRFLFWRANALTCVSKDMVKQFHQVFDKPPHVDVYNIINDASARERMVEPINEPWLVDKQFPVLITAGRLDSGKNFALLIDAVALLKQRDVTVRTIIFGEGPTRAELERQIADHRLGDVVKLPGVVSNPLKYFARADVFVLTSRFEGLPNVLIEAMVAGCTPVATDCPTGPAEVLTDKRFGYLVPMDDAPALADAIEEALQRPISKEALAEAVAPFSEKAVLARHFEILGLANAA